MINFLAVRLLAIRFLFPATKQVKPSELAKLFDTDQSAFIAKLMTVRLVDIYIFKAAQLRVGAFSADWANAELQRRDFVLKQISLVLATLAFVISIFSAI